MVLQILLVTFLTSLTASAVIESPRDARLIARSWTGPDQRSELGALPFDAVGGYHGTPFTDVDWVGPFGGHKRISSITLGGCGPGERVSMIKIGYRNNHADHPVTGHADYAQHGTYHGKNKLTLNFGVQGYVFDMQVGTYRAKVGLKRKTRVGYMRIENSDGQSIECGVKAEPIYKWNVANQGYLLYLAGNSGDEIDLLQGYFLQTRTAYFG